MKPPAGYIITLAAFMVTGAAILYCGPHKAPVIAPPPIPVVMCYTPAMDTMGAANLPNDTITDKR